MGWMAVGLSFGVAESLVNITQHISEAGLPAVGSPLLFSCIDDEEF